MVYHNRGWSLPARRSLLENRPCKSVQEGQTEWFSGNSLHFFNSDQVVRDVSMMEERGLRSLHIQDGDPPFTNRTGLLVLRAGPRQCLSAEAMGTMEG